ncbi:MAG: ribosomal protein S18-alanine N-acetyltransferase [Gammaproteobacteria bacterium]|nr:ribosomal protein S18-alanine N-acetyltransferase [Gammaproteobacteria bacterium]
MNAVTHEELQFSHMRPSDVKEVMATEVRAYPTPWTEGIVRDCISVGYDCQVARLGGEIVAYAFMSVALNEAHLLNLTVKPDLQGQGYGRRMLLHMLDRAETRQADTVFLEVRPSNRVARQLYRSLGFHQIGRRKNYYPDPNGREDALVYSLILVDVV